jgi:hypothetical protein
MLDVVAVGEAPAWARVYEEQYRCGPRTLVHVVYVMPIDFDPVIAEWVEVGIYPVRTINVFLHLASLPILQLEAWMTLGLTGIVVDRGVFC